MKKKDSRFQSFDLIIMLIFFGSVSSLFFYGRLSFLISICLIITATLMLVVLCGRLVAPLYLEGCMVRNLIANNGELPIGVFKKHFGNYSSYDDLFKSLLKRNVMEVVNKAVVLKNRNYQKGIQNRIMMWGTRKIRH